MFEIESPELEQALKESMRDGSNARKLVLLGIEIVNKPKPTEAKPIAAALIPPAPPEPDKLKAALLEKHSKKNSWRFWQRSEKPKPLPLP